MGRTIITIMNGMPLSGKSTIQNKIKNNGECMLPDDEYDVTIQSSVEVPYQCMKLMKWNGVKDEQFRKDMVALKQMYIRRCNGPITDIIRTSIDLVTSGGNHILFTDIREAEEIAKLQKLAEALSIIGISVKTVLVRRKQVEDIEHEADVDNVLDKDIKYDITVDNSGDERSLFKVCKRLVLQLFDYNFLVEGDDNGGHSGHDGLPRTPECGAITQTAGW